MRNVAKTRVFAGWWGMMGTLARVTGLVGLGVMAALPLRAEVPVFAQAVAEAATEAEPVAAFYKARDYRALWTRPEDAARRAAFFAALEEAGAHGLPVARYDLAGLRAAFGAVATERDRAQLDVQMTRAYLAYARDISSGALEPRQVDPGILREINRRNPAALLAGIAGSDPEGFLARLAPKDAAYNQLMRAKFVLEQAVVHGGWGPAVPMGTTLRPGDQGASVVALRDRLMAMGYLGRTASAVYDGALQAAVQRFQMDNGITADGIAGEGTLTEVNRDPADRLAAVVVAMERLRWMNGMVLGARHVWVNLPDFSVKIVDDGKVSFESVTVVGMNQADRRSPEFSDQMELMVINPSWSVPRSITVKEYLPMLQQNPNAAGHLRIVDRRGRVVPRDQIDFAAYSAKSFPYSMQQAPSDDNALGLVKFLFPNPYNIYLHDTPSKSLFDREIRAFSHGCIRVGRPFDLAYHLLERQEADPEAFFAGILKTGAETPVRLKDPVPVHLVYFTAYPDARGHIQYRRDIYGRDAALFRALTEAGLTIPGIQG